MNINKILLVFLVFGIFIISGCGAGTVQQPPPVTDNTPDVNTQNVGSDDSQDDGTDDSDDSGDTNGGATAELKEFTVTARQWQFDPGTITVNKGDTVKLTITSIDVAHGFAISQFGVNSRLNPGQTTVVEFVADEGGTFSFFCTVQCGAGHSTMRGTLVVNE